MARADTLCAAIAVLVTMEPPTDDMMTAALAAGYYCSPAWGKRYRRVQILTVADLFAGHRAKMPPAPSPYRDARKEEPEGMQEEMEVLHICVVQSGHTPVNNDSVGDTITHCILVLVSGRSQA